MSVRIVLSVLFFITTVEAPNHNDKIPTSYACKYQNQPENCLNNSTNIYVETYKTGDTYQLILVLNDQNITFNFKCCAICEACKSLESGKCEDNEECEQKVDAYLNNFCEGISPSTSNLLAAHTQGPSESSKTEARSTTVALGSLLGLCLVLLLVVTGGWLYTCRALKTQKRIQRPQKNSLEEQRTANDGTDSDDGMEKHVHNPLHEESTSVHNYPPPGSALAPIKHDPTKIPPSNKKSFNQNDAIISVIGSRAIATAPLSAAAMDDQKEKHLKNPIYEGSLEFQTDRYYERENYDCSQDDNDDYMYDSIEQGSTPERDAAITKRFSDSGSMIAARHEEMSSISDFPVARYDAVSRPHYEEGEDYDVLDHEIHIGSNKEATSGFGEEKHLKNPIYEGSPCSSRSDKITQARDIQNARFERASSNLQEDSKDYDVLEPEIDVMHVVAANTQPVRYEHKSHDKNASYAGGHQAACAPAGPPGPPAVAPKPRIHNLHSAARYDTVDPPCHDYDDCYDDGGDYDVLEGVHDEMNGDAPVRDDPYNCKSYSHFKL